MKVICKYVAVDQNDIQVKLGKDGNNDILELNIMLPEK